VSLGKEQDPISKLTRAKRVGGVAQVVECLSSKHEILSSHPTTTKKKKESEATAGHGHAYLEYQPRQKS
jgi:hypothetical protein